ncbi:putative DNA binding protein [Parathielavia appendiculata]|uniref:DNA binding protein n=1 Tax=Parathielavia appendiculata TaxID=2587402 RepID=A0AAN6U9J3_9PEZI|nr:putative DNA binding protein [Parathielavia appendiculata]
MDELLRPASIIRTITGEKKPEVDFLRESRAQGRSSNAEPKPNAGHKPPTSLEDALEILRHEPDYDSLIAVLAFLFRHKPDGASFPSIKLPSPLSAQLVQVLVSQIVPNYWTLLLEDSHQTKDSGLRLLLYCLASSTGVNAALVRLSALIQEAKSEATARTKRPDLCINLGIILDLLCRLVQGDGWLLEAYRAATSSADGPARVKPRVQEIVTTFGNGRLISMAAEAEATAKANGSNKLIGDNWLADPSQYVEWLGRNIAKLVSSGMEPEQTKSVSGLFVKALHLGHPEKLIKQLLSELVLRPHCDAKDFKTLLGHLPQSEQRKVLFSVLKLFSVEHLDRLGRCDAASTPTIAAVAGALDGVLGKDENGRRHLVEWLTASSGAGLGDGVGIRRAVMAFMSQNKDDLVNVLEKSLSQFGDQLYIKHSPMLQQEAHAQILLLAAGYVHRLTPIKLSMLLRSSVWLNAISNRLAAPHTRARFLGMVVGEALSGLVDKGDKRLSFKMEETDQDEGKWYKGLTEVSDEIGPLQPLIDSRADVPRPKKREAPRKPVTRPAPQPPQTGFIIEELSDGGGPEEDDIVPYAKPDSDPEDSDDDATLVRRNKPKAPVYIRDLIKYLRDTDSYDHQKLALTTAPTLIRRKAGYGTEVSEHAEELASLLVGLSDKFETKNFDELRIQGMIAIVVAKPEKMGQWFAKTFFDGDYSISQRASVLVVLGLSARELAGLETSDYAAAASFPSKTLPERAERLYLGHSSTTQPSSSLKPLPPNALDNIATSLTSAFLAPLAATAADAATGPDILKLSTFTSRLTDDQTSSPSNPKVKYKSQPRAKPRLRAIPNNTAHLLSTSFFSPLIARFQAALHTAGSLSSRTGKTILFHPYLLALYLKTLALLLHAAGPSTLALPHMTAELWRLLLSTGVRAQAVGDLSVIQAVLFGYVALLDVNEDRMREVCVELGREVVEAVEWVAGVFGGLRGGDEGGEEERVKALAAAVLVRLREGVEKYRLLLIGDLIGFG